MSAKVLIIANLKTVVSGKYVTILLFANARAVMNSKALIIAN